MLTIFIVAISFALARGALRGTPDVTFCNTSTSTGGDFVINSYSFQPPNVVTGENVTITLNGVLKVQVTSGDIYEKATYGPTTIINKHYDLCTETAQAGLPCPIAAGAISLKQVVDIPSGPGLKLVDLSNLTAQNNIFLACVQMTVQL
mmetsp:Transcript_18525/g.29369  ORF Transcript_18525/g.29369 Transcript_18525/m.29369 type:complete len:148 (+) Transcript_18525:61-504(+)